LKRFRGTRERYIYKRQRREGRQKINRRINLGKWKERPSKTKSDLLPTHQEQQKSKTKRKQKDRLSSRIIFLLST
jgi:hypothetical protein